ncbi:MAG: glycosyltransferase family 9 protein [Bacteroidia bacterium]|nr:glycosyltransferase family 9 protein [Bacteroidia bacterium]MDW8159487.1 glycosyltransferase family 9 protein [Bacteroidia bacterium]
MPYSNILIIQTAFIGDVILALPVAQNLRQNYPHSKIHFLVREGNQNLLQNHPAVDCIWSWHKQKHKWKNWVELYKKLRCCSFDLIINLQRHFAMGLLTFLLKAKEKRGFSQSPFSFCYTYKIPHLLGEKNSLNFPHEVERNLNLLQNICSTYIKKPELYPSAEDYNIVASYLAFRPFIVVAPTSTWYTKQYPLEKWKEFLSNVPLDLHIFIIGGQQDYMIGQKLLSCHPQIINLAGKLTLLQTAALVQNAEQLFTNDSAPLHIGSAMQTPTSAIFTSTIPEFGFGPLSPHSKIIQTSENLQCRPCGKHGKKSCPQGHFRCAYSISTQQLLDTLRTNNYKKSK